MSTFQDIFDHLKDALRTADQNFDRISHKRIEREEWIDEVRIQLVPRYKTSYLSGDEWRTSAHVQLMRKGEVLYERSTWRIEDAAAWLPWGLRTVGDVGEMAELPNADFYCSQPGCADPLVTMYRIKSEYNVDGDVRSYQYPSWRGFCARHSQRGDAWIRGC